MPIIYSVPTSARLTHLHTLCSLLGTLYTHTTLSSLSLSLYSVNTHRLLCANPCQPDINYPLCLAHSIHTPYTLHTHTQLSLYVITFVPVSV
ncbi:hypothetical protein XELAEV_18045494mg [Xenopus laevis]|uniref:Uncharacterized protein n=1 Tax=Xenopus laevis TaxID=8355 RepID=A0A974C118_XENLA|nr:hypothetical protein XELAEV_18045494mg [Xenopus laevis]